MFFDYMNSVREQSIHTQNDKQEIKSQQVEQ